MSRRGRGRRAAHTSPALRAAATSAPPAAAPRVRPPGVDKIAFTGATATGSEIMRLGADTIKRLTLELGGKSPNIAFDGADLGGAIARSAWAVGHRARR